MNSGREKLNILFICSGNSFRSQIAEAWGNHLRGDEYNFYSAGTRPHAINPRAVQVMAMAGIDMSHHVAKDISALDRSMDVVITVCDKAKESCPVFPQAPKVIHVDIEAPSAQARQAANEEEALAIYCRVRDELRAMVEGLDRYLRTV